MAVAYQSTTGFAEGNSTSIAGVAKPASTAIGDVLVAQCYIENAGEALTIASTGDTWTLVPPTGPATNTGTTPDMHLWVWICVVANASSTVGVTWGGGSFWRDFAVHRFTGVDTTTPQDTTATENTGSGDLLTFTGLTTATAGAELVALHGEFDGVSASGEDAPLVERNDSGNVGMASGAQAIAGSSGNKTLDFDLPTSWAAVLMALRPVVASAALTGTVISAPPAKADVVAGGKTIIATLTNDTYVSDTKPTPLFGSATPASTTTAPGRTGNGTFTATLPAATVAGQFGVCVVYHDQGTASIDQSWLQVTGSPFGAGTEKLQIFYKVLGTGESSPVLTITGSGVNVSHCANVLIYDNVKAVGVIGTASNGTGSPMTAAQITVSAASIVVACAGRGDNETSGSQTFGGSATGVNERSDAGTDQGNDSQVSVADKTIAAGGATGAFSSTTSATDPWVCVQIELLQADSPFTNAKAAIIAGLDSAQAEANGWDARRSTIIPVANIVQTSSTVMTITLAADASYDITATETITATLPASALTAAGAIVATPTFQVTAGAFTNPEILGRPMGAPGFRQMAQLLAT